MTYIKLINCICFLLALQKPIVLRQNAIVVRHQLLREVLSRILRTVWLPTGLIPRAVKRRTPSKKRMWETLISSRNMELAQRLVRKGADYVMGAHVHRTRGN